jgi:methyl-accepting chemotaxis protein
MPPLGHRQVYGIFALLVALAAIISIDRAVVPYAAALAALGVFIVVWSGGGAGGASLSGLRDAVDRARSGKPQDPPPGSPPELGEIYGALSRVADTVNEFTEKSQERERDIEEATTQVSDALRRIGESTSSQLELSETSGRSTKEMTNALREIAQHVEMLAASAEESSSSILEMTATNDEMAEHIGELSQSVRESVSSIEEMTYSIKEVAKNVDALSLTAEETSSSMNEMDVSIDQVQSNANETARLSEEVARDAEHGAESILKTIGEIYRIKESSQEAVAVISNLGSRIDAIGQILNVIDEVAEQTNLLALNAAIIAAQAGEHGKGFAVVADEIKDLAERAGASTKEIADLIKTIQAESRNAIQAVERGAQNVDRGVQVSNEAERALKKILESSQKSTNMVRAIARATVEQAKGSKQVTDAIGRIAETVQQIAAATAQQARGTELIMKTGETMRTVAQQVERSSQEQSRGGRQITQAIESISNMVHQLNSAHRQQSRGSEQSIEAAKHIEEAAKLQDAASRDLLASVGRLKKATTT